MFEAAAAFAERFALLADMPVVDLLTEPIQSLAERWQTVRLQAE